jgi:hypothetical protein
MLKIVGVNGYLKKSKKQRAQIRNGAAEFVRGQAKKILKDLVLNTPQWTGNTAASWQIETPSVSVSYYDTVLERDWKELDRSTAYFKGDTQAWKVALANAQPALRSIRYNSTIKILNTAPYADELATLPEEELGLRRGNYIPGDVMAVNLATAKYKLSSNVVGLGLKQVMNYG